MLITMCLAVFIGYGSPTPYTVECQLADVKTVAAYSASCKTWDDPMSTCEEIHYRKGAVPIVVFELTTLTKPDVHALQYYETPVSAVL